MSLTTFISDAVGIWKHKPATGASHSLIVPDLAQMPPDTRRLVRNRRYCLMLSRENSIPFDDVSIDCAWKTLQHEMALVPAGDTFLVNDTVSASGGGAEIVSNRSESTYVKSLYLDRHCVSNTEYAKFVQSDGYANPCYWPEAILPNVLQFVDRTGHPGPRYWSNGNPPPKKLNHPVVGISWYEANAYATWAGKRIPTSEQWQRAGTWSKGRGGEGLESRYPWGNSFDPAKANTWASRIGDTVPVDSYDGGRTSNGIVQLIGNVWQWIDAQYYPHSDSGLSVLLDDTMAEIRGGAFDTYFHSQATCQFRSGQPVFFRGANVGFRCCIGIDDLEMPVNPDTPDACSI
jgi:gamma-glutamyl hercynylcysteine S-oxide synthase